MPRKQRVFRPFSASFRAAQRLLFAERGIFPVRAGDYSRSAAFSNPNFSTRYRI